MGVRWIGLTLALALVGVLAGVTLARHLEEGPVSVADVTPAVASSPAFPTDPPVQVLPDPDVPPLQPALPSHVATAGQEPFGLRLPVPDGWVRSNAKAGEWRWFVEDNPTNTYVLRVVLPSGYTTIASALENRITALADATGIQDFQLEARTGDTFVANYVSENHRRLTMERFLSLDGSETVYANIALTGRMVDREGMADLLERVTAGARR